MKKKFLAVILTLTMAVSMMACGKSEEKYEDDLDALEDLYEVKTSDLSEAWSDRDADDVKEAIKDIEKDIKEVKFSTKEGKAIQKAYLDSLSAKADYYLSMIEAEEAAEDAAKEFKRAAKDAGVDKEDLEEAGF